MSGCDRFFDWLEHNEDAQEILERKQMHLMVSFARENGFSISVEEVMNYLDDMERDEAEEYLVKTRFVHPGYLN